MGNGFKNLLVWQRGRRLAVLIYKTTDAGPIVRDFGLRDQMRRAAVSIASNIAEGDERDTDKDAVRFFYMAKGSAAELQTQLLIAGDIGYIENREMTSLCCECESIAKMLSGLISARTSEFRS